MSFFRHEKFSMHYEIIGNFLPRDTVFIHGGFASNRWWKPTISIWQSKLTENPICSEQNPNYQIQAKYEGRAILAEWRGCGLSSAPKSFAEIDPKIIASDYLELMDFLGVRSANIVGHSAGAIFALMAAFLNPSVIEKIIVLNPVAVNGVYVSQEKREIWKRMSRDKALLAKVLEATMTGLRITNEEFSEIVDDAFSMAPLNWEAVPKMISTLSIESLVKRIQVPTLVVHGQKDTVLPIEGAQELAQFLPNSDILILENIAHCCNLEDPQQFMNICNNYFFSVSEEKELST